MTARPSFGGRGTVAVVPSFNGEAHLDSCLRALLASDERTGVLVVDDGSTDSSVRLARVWERSHPERVRVVALGRNHGFAGAVNRGVASLLAESAPPSFVVLVNQDCVVRRGWLGPLVAALGDSSVAVAGARLLESDGTTLQHAGARIEPNGLTTHIGRGDRTPGAHRDARDCDYVCGAVFAFRTATWKKLGPFDEGYAPAYYEEVDFCVRARRAGLRTVYVPASEAVHAEASSSASPRTFFRRYHRNRLRFVVRHVVRERGFLAWVASELAWLPAMRDRSQALSLVAAYLEVPRFLFERVRDARTASPSEGAVS